MQNTIIQRIQPNCDSLWQRLKAAKEASRKTNQQIADETGISISTISKFFSGVSSAPSVFNISALCICLNVSLDALMGIRPPAPSGQKSSGMSEEHQPILKNMYSQATISLFTFIPLTIKG